jgi:hypothetical protein
MTGLPKEITIPPYQKCLPVDATRWPSHKKRGQAKFPEDSVLKEITVIETTDCAGVRLNLPVKKKVLDASHIEHRTNQVAFWVGNFVEKDVDIRMEQMRKNVVNVYDYTKDCFSNASRSIGAIPEKVIRMLEIDALKGEVKANEEKIELLEATINEMRAELDALREEQEGRSARTRERSNEADPNTRTTRRLRRR